jgi:ADP-ribose pyrophosphatase YjhB (NUDIX family)
MAESVHHPSEGPRGIVLCVGGVVLKEGRLLFVRQAEGHPLEGQWTIPWGLMESGETPEEAVVREIQEEAGVDAEVEGLLGIQNLPAPWKGWIGVIFLCRHLAGTPKPDGGVETDRASYFNFEDLAAFKDEIEPWCAWLAERIFSSRYRLIFPEPDNPYHPEIGFF